MKFKFLSFFHRDNSVYCLRTQKKIPILDTFYKYVFKFIILTNYLYQI